MRLYKFRGKWWCRWTEHGVTVKRSCRTTDQEAAKLIARQWERERADPGHSAKAKASFAVEAGHYLEDRKAEKVPAGTLNMYQCKVGHLVRLLPERMAGVNVAACDAYFETRKAEGASTSTLYKEWVALRQVLTSATRRGVFSHDIKSLKPRWVTPGYKPREKFLTLDEVDALCAHLAPERAALVAFFVATGCRRAEGFRARREDVDARRNFVHLRGTKTEGSRRTVPVPSLFAALLRQALKDAAPVAIGKPMFAAWPNARRDLIRAAERAGTKAPTWNDLRRTFASLLIQAGVSNEVVAKLLGHGSTAMVDKVYGRQTADTLAQLLSAQLIPPGSHRSRKQT